MARRMKLGLILQGVGIDMSGWRHPEMKKNASVDINWYIEKTKKAEAEKLDIVFVTDGLFINKKVAPHFLNRLEPLTLLSALAVETERIGLVGTVSTSYNEPFTVARQLASLDMISNGRAGWNVVTSPVEAAATNFNIRKYPAHALRYQIAEEFIQVVQALWDSWEDDAFVDDKENDVFFDPDKLHALNHEGEYFSVAGPLNIARSIQGQPAIFQAGASDDGKDYAARHAHGIFVTPKSLEESQAYYSDVKKRAAAFGRNPDEISILPGINPIVGRTAEEAEEKYQAELSLMSLTKALQFLGRFFNHHDFTVYDPDAPFPDVEHVGSEGFKSTTLQIIEDARRNGLTLRQAAYKVAKPRSLFMGTPEAIADKMQQWVEQGGADGFMLHIHSVHGFEDFAELVLPVLRERGLFREEYESNTLRGLMNVPIPENRYTKARRESHSRSE